MLPRLLRSSVLGAGKGLRHHLPGIHLGILSGQLQILEISVSFLGLSVQAMTLMRWLLRDMWLCIIHIQMIRNICLLSGMVGSISCVFFHMTQRFIYRMKGRIVESDGEDDRKRIRKTLGLLCAFLGILVVAAINRAPRSSVEKMTNIFQLKYRRCRIFITDNLRLSCQAEGGKRLISVVTLIPELLQG